MNLGVHRNPPPAELEAYVESVKVSDYERLFDSPPERALRAAFRLREEADRLPDWLP